ncbi:ABC-2 transporter permease [Aerococcus urinaeequi]|uniref:ABC-2 transporter permease n=1 Tax=Aerococcus urinaeequi TaxID=51665 RepID=A0AA47G8G4_9LACT|nr:ABC-2 transporter permease [Aerococcus urinaeequi]WAT24240.1 ABC-2 transporter permease [Aerococcus urinaeequi]
MKSLLLKDFYVITKQLKIFLIIIPVIALTTGEAMSTFSILLGAVLPMTAIAYDERSKWNELAAMMPYSKFDLIFSKYLLGYICMFGAAVLAFVGQIIGKNTGILVIDDNLNVLLFAIMGGLIFIAINTPILFKFGSEKGRFVFIITMGIVGASGPILQKVDSRIILEILNLSPVILIAFVVILNVISIMISMNVKKDKA